jgi:hypothetical protein
MAQQSRFFPKGALDALGATMSSQIEMGPLVVAGGPAGTSSQATCRIVRAEGYSHLPTCAAQDAAGIPMANDIAALMTAVGGRAAMLPREGLWVNADRLMQSRFHDCTIGFKVVCWWAEMMVFYRCDPADGDSACPSLRVTRTSDGSSVVIRCYGSVVKLLAEVGGLGAPFTFPSTLMHELVDVVDAVSLAAGVAAGAAALPFGAPPLLAATAQRRVALAALMIETMSWTLTANVHETDTNVLAFGGCYTADPCITACVGEGFGCFAPLQLEFGLRQTLSLGHCCAAVLLQSNANADAMLGACAGAGTARKAELATEVLPGPNPPLLFANLLR